MADIRQRSARMLTLSERRSKTLSEPLLKALRKPLSKPLSKQRMSEPLSKQRMSEPLSKQRMSKQRMSKQRMSKQQMSKQQMSKQQMSEQRMSHSSRLRSDPMSKSLMSVQPSEQSAESPYVAYPDTNDANLASILASKREFREVVAPSPLSAVRAAAAVSTSGAASGVMAYDAVWSGQCGARSGFVLTDQQRVVRNFVSPLTPYNGLLLFHGVGVGKTCSAIGIAEQFDDVCPRGVLVITRPSLRDAFRRQIFDASLIPDRGDGSSLDYDVVTQCTGSKYVDQVRDRAVLGREEVQRRVQRIVSAKYTFMGPQTFAKAVMRMGGHGDADGGNARLRAYFSERVIIVDEAHNLRNARASGNDASEPMTAAPRALRRVLDVSEGVKLLLLTATPMFNDARDVMELINLLRLNDKLPPTTAKLFDVQGRLRDETGLINMARGYVSYVRGGSPLSFPSRLQPSINRDKAVLDVTSSLVLNMRDIKGDSIPADERLQGPSNGLPEIVVTQLSRVQHDAYKSTAEAGVVAFIRAQQLRGRQRRHLVPEDAEDGGDAGGGESEDDEGHDDLSAHSDAHNAGSVDALSDGGRASFNIARELCNIVYPLTGGRYAHGVVGFNACFERVRTSANLSVRYRPDVPHVLDADHIDQYAPKIAAVLGYVRRCRGVALIYSRFIWSGIVPMALALEHAGFSRYDNMDLLADGLGRHKDGKQKYMIIAGDKSLTTSSSVGGTDGVMQAVRAANNVNGEVIKVVLVSDKGAEGVDLKYVRECHILEPWYHLNKVEQVIGRSARHCSHAGLPSSERNVTIYLHAAGDLQSGRGQAWPNESVDLRAHRMAQLKQERINNVERVLRAVAIDCPLNLAASDFHIGVTLDITTSQGVRVPRFEVGDRQGRGKRTQCAAGDMGRAMPALSDAESSTYSLTAHVVEQDVTAYKAVIRTHYAATRARSGIGARATFEDLMVASEGKVRQVDRHAHTQLLALALDSLLNTPMRDRHGALGRLEHRGSWYVLVLDRDDGGSDRKQLRLSFSSGSRASSSSAANASPSNEIVVNASVMLARQAMVMRRVSCPPSLVPVLSDVALDFVVDRLETSEVMQLLRHLKPNDPSDASMLQRLLRSGVVFATATERFVWDLRSGRLHCVVKGGGKGKGRGKSNDGGPVGHGVEACDAYARTVLVDVLAEAQRAALAAPPPVAYLQVKQSGKRGGVDAAATVFKMVCGGKGIDLEQSRDEDDDAGGGRGARRTGCVCSQTSSITLAELVAIVQGMLPSNERMWRLDKRAMCEIYELLLRRFRPNLFARPAHVHLLAPLKRMRGERKAGG